MLTKDQYNEKIEKIKNDLGEHFSLISGVISELSTDYDTVIIATENYEKQIKDINEKHQAEIQKMNDEKTKILENNNSLFTQLTNQNKKEKDPVIEEEKAKNPTNIDSIINEKGELE